MHAPNKLYVTLSLALSLFLLGLVAYWAWQAHALTQRMRSQVKIVVELEPDHTADQRQNLLTYLESARFTDPVNGPEFEDKESGLRALDPELASDLQGLGINNPLLDVVTFTVPIDYLSEDSLSVVVEAVQLREGVLGAHYPSSMAGSIADSARRVTFGLLGLAVVFLLITAILIHNTVRLSLSANRMLIKTQELVGASWGFIHRPYLWRGIGQGFGAGLLAATGLVAAWLGVDNLLPDLGLVAETVPIAIVAGGVLALGVIISFLSYYIGVRRYLRLPIDELY